MNRLLRLLIFSIILLTCIPNAVAEKFRVTDEYVTVFAEEARVTQLGRIYRGEVYEAIGQEGTMYIFNFKGRKAYVATYCCKIVEENEAPTSASDTKSQGQAASSQQQSVSERQSEKAAGVVSSKDNEQVNHFKWVDDLERKRNSIADTQIPDWLAKVIGSFGVLGFFIGVWTLFGPLSCDNFFDFLAGERITWCSNLTYFRPLILVFGQSFIFVLTRNMNITFAVAAIYEIILICVRAKKLRGLRPAIVEALYLFFYGMGQLIFCWLYLMRFAFAPSGSTGKSKGKDVNQCCGRCYYYCKDIPSDYCSLHGRQTVHPSDSCGSFKGL